MVFIAVIALVLGVICGKFVFPENVIRLFTDNSDYVLYLLMFSVGISVGMNKSVFKKIRQYHVKIFLIPIGIIAGTVVGGFVCSLLLGERLSDSMAVVSGMGWYSLSGVLVTSMINARMGAIAFLSSLLREIMSFLTIPWIAKHFNHYTAIAPAAATSEDTTLPMLMKYTSEEVVVLAVFNGVACSIMVPVLTKFLYDVFRVFN